jgi:hypothetical protein
MAPHHPRHSSWCPIYPVSAFTEVPTERKFQYTSDGPSPTIEAFFDALSVAEFTVYIFAGDHTVRPVRVSFSRRAPPPIIEC